MTRRDGTGSLQGIFSTSDVETSARHILLCLPQSATAAIDRRSRSVTGSLPDVTRENPNLLYG